MQAANLNETCLEGGWSWVEWMHRKDGEVEVGKRERTHCLIGFGTFVLRAMENH